MPVSLANLQRLPTPSGDFPRRGEPRATCAEAPIPLRAGPAAPLLTDSGVTPRKAGGPCGDPDRTPPACEPPAGVERAATGLRQAPDAALSSEQRKARVETWLGRSVTFIASKL